MTVTVTLELKQQTDNSVSPDNTGIDAKKATVQLPETFSFNFNNTTSKILAAGDASWNLYGQPDDFTFDNQPAFYLPQLNRIGISYNSSQVNFDALNCESVVCNVRGSAAIQKSAWSLDCAALDINNPLEANGIGGMMILADKGLFVSWYGLKEVNLKNKEWISLRNAWILLEPGHIFISDLNAGNINARQQYKLWRDKQKRWNTIDLQYTDSFIFFYNCLQAGNEAVMALTDCKGTLNKPVNVAAVPVELKSKQTFFLLTWSSSLQLVYLYDDNLLADNSKTVAGAITTFKPQAIALNNALLTISPATGFLFVGELKNEQEFSKSLLIYSFGLIGYLPTLPDPYAADLDVFQNVYRRYNEYNKASGIPVTAIRQLLIAMMTWADDISPSVNFIWGDIITPQAQNANEQIQQNVSDGVLLNVLKDKNIAIEHSKQIETRQTQILTQQYKAAGNTYQPIAEAALYSRQDSVGRVGNTGIFSLLDVSTNADLFGRKFWFCK